MVTRLKSRTGRCLGLAVAAFLVFTLLASGSVLAQERHEAVQDTSFQDEFMAEAYALAAEIGAGFGLGADDAAALVETLLFTGFDAGPGGNIRWLIADLSAAHGLEPRELMGFLQVYGQELMALGQGFGLMPERTAGPDLGPRSAEFARPGPVGPARRWQADQVARLYGPRGMHNMQPEHGPYAVGPGTARADAMRYRFQRMHAEFHRQDAGHRYGGNDGRKAMNPGNAVMAGREHAWQGGPDTWGRYGDVDAAKASWHRGKEAEGIRIQHGGVAAWDRFDKRAFAPKAARPGAETPVRMRAERMRFGEHADGRIRGGQADFMDEDGMDVSVEAMMDLEHDVTAMVPVVLDVVGSTIVESLAESTGVSETAMEAMVVQALFEGLEAALDEGLVSQAEAMDLLMLLTGAGALEQ